MCKYQFYRQPSNSSSGQPSGVVFWIRVLALMCVLVVSTPQARGQAGGGDPSPSSEWRVADAIEVTITLPTADGWELYINQQMSCAATATDRDEYSNDGGVTWYPYYDDVTSGNTAEDYHISWSATEGTFTEYFGPTTTYIAPPYADGQDARDVTIYATATDVNRGTDVLGAPDGSATKPSPGKVFTYKISVDQGPTTSMGGHNPDNPPMGGFPPQYGGGKLGFIKPGDGVIDGYYGSTGVFVDLAAGQARPGGFFWRRRRRVR